MVSGEEKTHQWQTRSIVSPYEITQLNTINEAPALDIKQSKTYYSTKEQLWDLIPAIFPHTVYIINI